MNEINDLTVYELRILHLLSSGVKPVEIAKERGVSASTISARLVTIKTILNARTTAHAVAIAYQKGILK